VTYRVEASTNLANWLTITNLFSSAPVIYFRDAGATNQPLRFYRAVVP
jgi:hypothetical protein